MKSVHLLIVFFITLLVDKISEGFASQSLNVKLLSVQTANVFLQH